MITKKCSIKKSIYYGYKWYGDFSGANAKKIPSRVFREEKRKRNYDNFILEIRRKRNEIKKKENSNHSLIGDCLARFKNGKSNKKRI